MPPTDSPSNNTRPTEDALFECVSYYLANYDGRGVPETIIREMHKILLPNEYDAGRYRQIEVKIEGAVITPAATHQIAWLMHDALEALRLGLADSVSREAQVVAIITFFHRFNAIHPFRDGNGRVSRAVLHLLLRQQGVLDAQNDFYDVLALRRDEYLQSLKEADLGSSLHLIALISIGMADALFKDFLDDPDMKRPFLLLSAEDRAWMNPIVRSQVAITDYFLAGKAFTQACLAAIYAKAADP